MVGRTAELTPITWAGRIIVMLEGPCVNSGGGCGRTAFVVVTAGAGWRTTFVCPGNTVTKEPGRRFWAFGMVTTCRLH